MRCSANRRRQAHECEIDDTPIVFDARPRHVRAPDSSEPEPPAVLTLDDLAASMQGLKFGDVVELAAALRTAPGTIHEWAMSRTGRDAKPQ